MKKTVGVAILFASAVGAGALAADQSAKPDWAYAIPVPRAPAAPGAARPTQPPRPDAAKLYSLPGSDKQFTSNKIQGISDDGTRTRVAPGDWYPGDHPAMPKIVAEGDNARGIIACSLCHYPNGKGRSENAGVAGLPADYIARQLHDMRGGLRQSAEPRKANAKEMDDFAKAMTEDEIQAAATYFSSLPWTPWIKVVETKTVPKTSSENGQWIPLEGDAAGTEPIGMRIIEVPVDVNRTENLRDPHSSFIAYVPVGAVAAGKKMAATGDGGKTMACAVCHGDNLGGVGSIPGIAGRSPSYIARQLYDIQQGTRHGAMTSLMNPVVAKLSAKDIVDLAAYVASLPVPPAGAKGP